MQCNGMWAKARAKKGDKQTKVSKEKKIHLVTIRVSVQGVNSLGGHFACLCRGFDFYEVKKKTLFFKKKREILLY